MLKVASPKTLQTSSAVPEKRSLVTQKESGVMGKNYQLLSSRSRRNSLREAGHEPTGVALKPLQMKTIHQKPETAGAEPSAANLKLCYRANAGNEFSPTQVEKRLGASACTQTHAGLSGAVFR